MVGTLVPIASASTLLPAPTNVTATAVASYQVNVSWNAVSGATSYNIYRSTGGAWALEYTHVPQTHEYDNTCSPSTTYYYLVAGIDSSGQEGNSAESNSATTFPNSVPSAPTGLWAAAGYTTMNVGWNATIGASSYNVYRCTDGKSYIKIANVTGCGYSDSSLSNLTTYYYKITGVNSLGEGPGGIIVDTTL